MFDETRVQNAEALNKLAKDIQSCEACRLRKYGSTPVSGHGHFRARLFIIGIAPTVLCEQQGKPFIGDVGFKLDCWLEIAGLARSETYVTNAIKCVPRDSQGKPLFPSFTFDDSWWQKCRQWLKKEFSCVSAKIVILLGKQPVYWLRRCDSVARFQRENQGAEYHGKYWFALNHPSYYSRRGEWLRDTTTLEAAEKVRRLVDDLRQPVK